MSGSLRLRGERCARRRPHFGCNRSRLAVFKALADPTRREILRLLRAGRRSSGEIAEHFPSGWATISRHLAVLRDAELVTPERNGSTILYELDTTVVQDAVEHLLNWINPRGSNGKRQS